MHHSPKAIDCKSLFFALLITVGHGCSKTDDQPIRLSEMETPALTGFVVRDVTGNPIGTIGSPNISTRIEGTSGNAEYSIIAYPNPCKNMLALMIQSPNPNAAKKIWLVKGKPDAALANSGIDLGMNTAIVGGQPLFQATTVATNLTLDVSSFPGGYYRLYVKVEDRLLYENLIIN